VEVPSVPSVRIVTETLYDVRQETVCNRHS
jgi:hypothetical protein